jgi:RNA polymerase sigma factor (TIGR02999 family)
VDPEDLDPTVPDITGLLGSWRAGDRDAFDRIFPIVYEELRILARRQLQRAGGSPTLQTTALLHEAYVKLVQQSRATVEDRGHFFALAARAMRHILVDHARKRGAAKRGADRDVTLADEPSAATAQADEILEIDRALERLEAVDPRLGRVVEMRFFGGMSVEETADALAVSPRTVKRDWQKAKAFLYDQLRGTSS